MKRLILMRHAKSDWSDLNATDHERSLNTRGQRSAAVMGDWMSENGVTPDHVLCSDSTRTVETLERLHMGDVPVTLTRKLYLAEPDVMRRLLAMCSEDCVMIIAHNPGSAILAEMLLSALPPHDDFARFPTAATLVIDFDIPTWRDLPLGCGHCAHFMTPRALMQ